MVRRVAGDGPRTRRARWATDRPKEQRSTGSPGYAALVAGALMLQGSLAFADDKLVHDLHEQIQTDLAKHSSYKALEKIGRGRCRAVHDPSRASFEGCTLVITSHQHRRCAYRDPDSKDEYSDSMTQAVPLAAIDPAQIAVVVRKDGGVPPHVASLRVRDGQQLVRTTEQVVTYSHPEERHPEIRGTASGAGMVFTDAGAAARTVEALKRLVAVCPPPEQATPP
jgi:hypothetical protein